MKTNIICKIVLITIISFNFFCSDDEQTPVDENERHLIYWSKLESLDNFLNPDKTLLGTPAAETLFGTVNLSTSTGKIGNSLNISMTASSAYIMFPFGKPEAIPARHTLSIWFRFSSISGTTRMVFQPEELTGTNHDEFRFYIDTNVSNLVINSVYYEDTSSGISDTNWHHLYWILDKEAGINNTHSWIVYLDNVKIMESTNAIDPWEGGFHLEFSLENQVEIDNLKVWDIIIPDPSSEWNNGDGLE